jgi:5-formyltetrahydrofolate cyclo-ligase
VCRRYDEEVVLDVPFDDHDRPVTAAATPTRWVELG